MATWGTTRKTRYPGIFKVTRTTAAGKTATSYRVFHRVRGQGQRTKSCRTLEEAREFRAKMRDPEQVRRLRQREKGKVLLIDYITAWVDQHPKLRPSTRRRYEDIVKMYVSTYFIGDLMLVDIEREDVKAWITELQHKGVGLPTVSIAYRALRACLYEAVKDGKIPANPAAGVAITKAAEREPFFLTPAQVDAIALQVPERDRALLRFLAYTGARIGEASALRVSDLDLLRRRAVIVQNSAEVGGHKLAPAATKTGKVRSVPLFADLVDELADHLERFGVRDVDGELDRKSCVFTGQRHSPIRQNNWRARVLQPAAERAGVTRREDDGELHPPRVHDLRHTAASLMAAHGYTLLEASRILGHASIRITADRYGHLFEEVTADKTERFGEAIRAEREKGKVIALPSLELRKRAPETTPKPLRNRPRSGEARARERIRSRIVASDRRSERAS